MARAVGIDLGTTNSVVAVLEGGEPTVIANAEGVPHHPVHRRLRQERRGAGRSRSPSARRSPTSTGPSGRSSATWAPTGTVDIDGKKYTAQEISARVLMKLKRDAEAYLGETITDAVITVPAYFNDAQRQATKEAGEIAGLNVLRIVNEPTAAALAYGLDKGEKEQTILVFDLGGGTFDVSLLEIGDGVVEVKATSGDNHLGGDDWDERDRRLAGRQVQAGQRHRPDQGQDGACSASARPRRRPRSSCPARSTTSHQPALHHRRRATRTRCSWTRRCPAPSSSRSPPTCWTAPATPFHQVIKDAGIKVGDIDHVVLVGGSTRMPAVTELVKELTGGKEPNKGVNPDEVVAVGAALQAGVLKRRGQGRPAARRHPAVPGHRDQGRHHDQADRAQHHDPDQALGDLHHGRGQPAVRADPGLPG